MRKALAALLGAALVAPHAPAGGAPARACAEQPAYRDDVTPPSEAIPGFPSRRATTHEILDYVALVDSESARVRSGFFGTSYAGTPMPYAFATRPGNLAALDEIAARHRALRDARATDRAEAAAIASSTPAFAWYTGNVHGDEPSGADAAIQILYELAARTDCEAGRVLDEVVTGVMPLQNPDGRDLFRRTNVYGFDLNRDWFARTQRETDGKLDVLRRYPPVVLVDAHEMGGSSFFFPPNADPVHHEISPQSLRWIDDVYAPALRAEFERRRAGDPTEWDYFNRDVYDLFYMGYADTSTTTGFTAAGMTFEKGGDDPDFQRWLEQWVAGWTTLVAAADHKTTILEQHHAAYRRALRDGRRGRLEPNRVYEDGNEVAREVPDERVRHYFVHAGRAFPDAAHLVERLVETDVEVFRLASDERVEDLQRYGRAPRAATVPAGTYWIPMAQPQKRWVQAMLGEDSYVPFPYFYDVTAWSNPLLMNLDASFSGAARRIDATRVRRAPRGRVFGAREGFLWFRGDSGAAVAGALALERGGVAVRRLRDAAGGLPAGAFVVPWSPDAADGAAAVARRFRLRVVSAGGRPPAAGPFRQPRVAVYSPGAGGESLGHLRWLLGRAWEVPFDEVTGPEVAAGALAAYDVFVVPGVSTTGLAGARDQVRAWIEGGGVYVGTARPGATGGTPFAVAGGFTAATLSQPDGLAVPGTLFRVRLGRGSRVTLGAPRHAYAFHLGEAVLSPSPSGTEPARFPGSEPEFWHSGYAEGAAALKGSAAVVDERLGAGRVVLFSGEPNYRAYTDGTSFLLANALVAPPPQPTPGRDVAAARWSDERSAARASAPPQTGPGRPLRVEVAARDAAAARRVLRRFDPRVSVAVAGGRAVLTIPDPRDADPDEHPFARLVLPALARAGVRVVSAIL